MQLLLALALILMLGGGAGNKPQISAPEMMEIIKYAAGDGNADQTLKELEQVSSVLEAIAPLARAFEPAQEQKTQHVPPKEEQTEGEKDGFNPAECALRPIADIAGDGIYNALARAVIRQA